MVRGDKFFESGCSGNVMLVGVLGVGLGGGMPNAAGVTVVSRSRNGPHPVWMGSPRNRFKAEKRPN